jgi:hypothetical protein
MPSDCQPHPQSTEHGWEEHTLSQLRYFRSLSLREKLQAVVGMADVVRHLRQIRAQGGFKPTPRQADEPGATHHSGASVWLGSPARSLAAWRSRGNRWTRRCRKPSSIAAPDRPFHRNDARHSEPCRAGAPRRPPRSDPRSRHRGRQILQPRPRRRPDPGVSPAHLRRLGTRNGQPLAARGCSRR